MKTISKQFANDQLFPHIVEMLNAGHTITLRLKGYSMRPFLEDGRDNALLCKPTTVSCGDVVLAEIRPGVYVLHRIVRLEADRVTLRGDGNIGTEQCRLADIRAFAVAFYRKGRSVPDYTSGKKWRIYSALWTRLLPIRRYLLFAYRLWLKTKQRMKTRKEQKMTI